MMGIKKVGWLVTAVVMAILSMGIDAQAQGHAVVDISEWQGRLSPAQVRAMKQQVLFVINRRQYGINYVDRDAVNNTALYVRYGIPFGEYDFSQFTDANSARREAQAFYARANKAARFYALDFEVDTVRSGSTNAAVAAWYHEMRSLTNKKLIFYSYASFALQYANQARQRFDAQWIGALTRNPPIVPAALWQYTDHYHLAGLAAPVDNSRVITSVHPVAWWLGTSRPAATVTLAPTRTAHVQQVKGRPIMQPLVRKRSRSAKPVMKTMVTSRPHTLAKRPVVAKAVAGQPAAKSAVRLAPISKKTAQRTHPAKSVQRPVRPGHPIKGGGRGTRTKTKAVKEKRRQKTQRRRRVIKRQTRGRRSQALQSDKRHSGGKRAHAVKVRRETHPVHKVIRSPRRLIKHLRQRHMTSKPARAMR